MRLAPARTLFPFGVGAVAVALIASCSDPISPGGENDRYYRLGNEADLVLHADSTYAFGAGGSISFSGPGRWTQRADTVVITPYSGPIAWVGIASGDTLTILGSRAHGRTDPTGGAATFHFVRQPVPPATMAGTRWVLRAATGATPRPGGSGFLVANTDIPDAHHVIRVAQDTLTFDDRVFFHESRTVLDSVQYVSADRVPYAWGGSWTTFGAYTASDAVVAIRYGAAVDWTETLALSGTTLIRRYSSGADLIEERYERVP